MWAAADRAQRALFRIFQSVLLVALTRRYEMTSGRPELRKHGGHGFPLTSAEEQQLMALLSGHPYLVRRALYQVASGQMSSTALFAEATDDRGPFGDHLRNQLFRLHGKPELIEGLRQVIQNHTCSDTQVFFRLRGAGAAA